MIVRVVVVLLAVGLVGAQRGEEARGTVGAVDELTLEQQVGQLLVLSFSGTSVPEYVREALRARRVAGVILFRGNIAGPGQLRALTGVLRSDGVRPIVAVDQEGGSVRRLSWAAPWQPSRSSSAAERFAATRARLRGSSARWESTSRRAGRRRAERLRGRAPRPRLLERPASCERRRARRSARLAIRGSRRDREALPRHRRRAGETDNAIVAIRRSRAELDAVDLPPFSAAIDAGVPLVMVGHARYPALDRNRIASQSQPIIEGVLREELGFRGVVVTDSMEVRASLATGSITNVSERAIRAVADLLLLTRWGSYRPVYDHLLAIARSSPVFRARVQESAARVLESSAAAPCHLAELLGRSQREPQQDLAVEHDVAGLLKAVAFVERKRAPLAPARARPHHLDSGSAPEVLDDQVERRRPGALALVTLVDEEPPEVLRDVPGRTDLVEIITNPTGVSSS